MRDSKSAKIDNIHKIHVPKFQGRVFSEGVEAPQAAATQPQWAWGPDIDKHAQNAKKQKTQDTCSKIQGVCFSEGAEAAQADATQTQRAAGP